MTRPAIGIACLVVLLTAWSVDARDLTYGPWTVELQGDRFKSLAFDGTAIVEGTHIVAYKPAWSGTRFAFSGAALSTSLDKSTLTWRKAAPSPADLTLVLSLTDTSAEWTLHGTITPEGPLEFGIMVPAALFPSTRPATVVEWAGRHLVIDREGMADRSLEMTLTVRRPRWDLDIDTRMTDSHFVLQDRRQTSSCWRVISVLPVLDQTRQVQARITLDTTRYGEAVAKARAQRFKDTLGTPVTIDVPNAGFELGNDGWQIPANARVVTSEAHSGDASALLEVTDPNHDHVYITRQIPVRGGAEYNAHIYLKTENVQRREIAGYSSVGACLIVEWADAQGKWLAPGRYATHVFGTTEWQASRCLDLRAPDEAGYAAVFLALRGTGRAWFDDFGMTRIDRVIHVIAPEPGIEIADNTPELSWHNDPRPSVFIVELSRDAEFPADATRIYRAHVVPWSCPDPLPAGRWFWRISAPGYIPSTPRSFVQTASLEKDTQAPEMISRAVRVTQPDQPAAIQVRESGDALRVTGDLAGTLLAGTARRAPNDLWEARLSPPESGWPDGLSTVNVTCTDGAGARKTAPLWLLCRPQPQSPIVIDEDGMYRADGDRIFPLGLYQVSPDHLARVKQAGFDVVHMYRFEGSQDDSAALEYLDAAHANGLRVFIGFDRGKWTGNGLIQGNEKHIVERVSALSYHPGLFCWYLFDEPEVPDQFISARALTAYADLIRALDPYHPVVVTTWGKRMNRYRKSWDTHWTQAYTTPAEVVQRLREHRDLLENKSPITLLVHCYDREQTSRMRQGLSVDNAAFQPDRDWMRAAAFAGLTQTINGLWWWYYAAETDRFLTVAHVPEAWDALQTVVSQLQSLEAILVAPGPTVVRGGPDADPPVLTWQKQTGLVRLIVCVNLGEAPVNVSIPAPTGESVDVLFENRKTDVDNGLITDHLDRYGVHVYRIEE